MQNFLTSRMNYQKKSSWSWVCRDFRHDIKKAEFLLPFPALGAGNVSPFYSHFSLLSSGYTKFLS
jgi:hypothetical protein